MKNLRPPFKPGQSGNPKGRPKKLPVTEIYQKILNKSASKKEIEEIVWKMLRGGRMSAMLQLKEMAERVEGKVSQHMELSGEVTMTLSERMQKARERIGCD